MIKGRPIEESRRIAEARLSVWDELARVWDELTDDEQDLILVLARRFAQETEMMNA